MPKTLLGRWSVRFIIVFFLLLLSVQLMVASGQTGGETFFDNLYISIPMALAGLSGVLALVAGAIAIVKHRERSPLVFIAALIGLFIVVFAFGEILGPAD